jgi:hypothetical protein
MRHDAADEEILPGPPLPARQRAGVPPTTAGDAAARIVSVD